MSRLSWLLAPVLLCACTATTSTIRTRFAKEHACPEQRVFVEEKGNRYRASGCDEHATYICGTATSLENTEGCVEQGIPAPRGYREPERPVIPPPDPARPLER